MKGARILCVEDEQALLNDLAEELQAAGYQTCCASSVAGALECLQHFSPDLVLCDVMLGDSNQADGYALHAHMSNAQPALAATPFIFLTALGQRDEVLRAKRLGVDDYLVKPVDYDLLLATLDARLAQVRRVRSSASPASDELLGRMRELFARLPTAVLLCDGNGQLLHANQQAQALMQERDLWRVNANRRLSWPQALPASAAGLQQHLQALASEAGGARKLHTLEMQRSSDNLLLCLLKLEGAASEDPALQLHALLICSNHNRPLPEAGSLRQLFGLTPSEARVAQLLAAGERAEAVAEQLAVSPATVNFHLRNLFLKTGVTRQADLIALLVSVGWSLPEPDGSGR